METKKPIKKFYISPAQKKISLIMCIVLPVICLLLIPVRNSVEEQYQKELLIQGLTGRGTGMAELLESMLGIFPFVWFCGLIGEALMVVSLLFANKVYVTVYEESVCGAVPGIGGIVKQFEVKYSDVVQAEKKGGKLFLKSRDGKKYYCPIENAAEAERLISEKLSSK